MSCFVRELEDVFFLFIVCIGGILVVEYVLVFEICWVRFEFVEFLGLFVYSGVVYSTFYFMFVFLVCV